MLDHIRKRRSIRAFLNKEPPIELIQEVIDVARHAPSSADSRPWEFLVVRNPETRIEMARAKGEENEWMSKAPIIIAICVDTKKSPTRWVDDGCAAAQNLLIAASELGLGACWVPGYSTQNPSGTLSMQAILKLLPNIVPVVLVPIGYPNETPEEKILGDLETVVHFEQF